MTDDGTLQPAQRMPPPGQPPTPTSPPLPPPLSTVRDRATAEAVALGHGSVTPWHLVRVLDRDFAQQARAVLGAALVTTAAMRLSEQPRTYTTPVLTAGASQALTVGGRGERPGRVARRDPAVGRPPMRSRPAVRRAPPPRPAAPSMPAGGPTLLSAIGRQYAEVATVDPSLVDRPLVVDAVLTALESGGTLLSSVPRARALPLAALLAAALLEDSYAGGCSAGPSCACARPTRW